MEPRAAAATDVGDKPVRYLPHIDGLRAIAVIAVIINHIDKSLLPGGFLGVDVFFVISGFVITASLSSREPRTLGTFLLAFYQRRIKRLLPALLTCVIVTGVAICVVDPEPHESLRTGLYALFGLSNVHLYLQAIDYFAPSAQVNAFTHTWSLGVEEQFYLIYPLLFWLCLSRGSVRRMTLWMGWLSLMSIGIFAWLFAESPAAGYFMTPARFWELGAGCLVFALRHSRPLVWVTRRIEAKSMVLIVALLAVMFMPEERIVLSTCLAVAISGMLLLGPSVTSPGYRLLSSRLMRYVGLISYSLYLWHWPVLVIARLSIGVDLLTAPFLLVVMFLLAHLSYSWIETPLRHRQGHFVVTAGLGASALASAGVLLLSAHHKSLMIPLDSTITVPPPFHRVKGHRYDPGCVVDGDKRAYGDATFDLCTEAPKEPELPTIWTMGDSHAGHLQGLIHQLHHTVGVGTHLIETPGRPYPFGGEVFEPRQRIVADMFQRARPGDILLVSRLYFQREDGGGIAADFPVWANELLPLAKELQAKQMHLVVVGPPPMFLFDSVTICQRRFFGVHRCRIDREKALRSTESVEQAIRGALKGQPNAHLFSPFGTMCPDESGTCSPVRNQMLMYRDRDHLNTQGAALLAGPFQRFLEERGLLLTRR